MTGAGIGIVIVGIQAEAQEDCIDGAGAGHDGTCNIVSGVAAKRQQYYIVKYLCKTPDNIQTSAPLAPAAR